MNTHSNDIKRHAVNIFQSINVVYRVLFALKLIPPFVAQSFHPKRPVRPTHHPEVPIQASLVNSTSWQPLQQHAIGDISGGALGQRVLNNSQLPIQRTINNSEQDYTCTTCGKPAAFVCSACKHVPYCSPECQVRISCIHWICNVRIYQLWGWIFFCELFYSAGFSKCCSERRLSVCSGKGRIHIDMVLCAN